MSCIHLKPGVTDLGTVAVRGGREPDPTTGAIIAPIVQSATYVQRGVGLDLGHTYSRCSNPTVDGLERALGALEDSPAAVCYSSGLAAVHALLLSTLSAGEHVIVSDVVYGGTYRLLTEVLARFGVSASFVDTADAGAVAGAIRPTTRLILIETPANPTLKLTDVAAVVAVARRAGVLLAVDNTFLTPVGLRPLDLGADVSVYSTTKYIDGHNTSIGGALVSRDEGLLEKFRFIRKTVGSIQAPHDAWLTLRGLTTLPLRLRRHSESAQVVAEWLEGRDEVERVLYPGLASFPQAELAARQHALHAGIIAFELRGGEGAGRTLMNSVRLCALAESLGSAETLITHPATMTHGSIPRASRQAAGISDGLVRLSVGLENPGDIIADLEQALGAVTQADRPRFAAAQEGVLA